MRTSGVEDGGWCGGACAKLVVAVVGIVRASL